MSIIEALVCVAQGLRVVNRKGELLNLEGLYCGLGEECFPLTCEDILADYEIDEEQVAEAKSRDTLSLTKV